MVMMTRPPAGTIPDAPGSYQFKDAPGRVIYVGKASSLRQRLSNYFHDPRYTAPAHGPDGGDGGVGRVDEVRNEVEALMLEYSLIKQHRPALQHPPARRQELPVPRRHRRRAVPAGAGDARPQAQGHPLLRAVRPRLRHPRHARRAAAHRSRSARAARRKFNAAPTPRPAVPAVPHREVLRAVRRRDRRDAVPPAGRRAVRLPRRRHRRRSSSASTQEMRAAADRAGVREGGPPARPPGRGAAGDRAPADGRRHATRTST